MATDGTRRSEPTTLKRQMTVTTAPDPPTDLRLDRWNTPIRTDDAEAVHVDDSDNGTRPTDEEAPDHGADGWNTQNRTDGAEAADDSDSSRRPAHQQNSPDRRRRPARTVRRRPRSRPRGTHPRDGAPCATGPGGGDVCRRFDAPNPRPRRRPQPLSFFLSFFLSGGPLPHRCCPHHTPRADQPKVDATTRG